MLLMITTDLPNIDTRYTFSRKLKICKQDHIQIIVTVPIYTKHEIKDMDKKTLTTHHLATQPTILPSLHLSIRTPTPEGGVTLHERTGRGIIRTLKALLPTRKAQAEQQALNHEGGHWVD